MNLMFLKKHFIYIILLFSLQAAAQPGLRGDTVKITEVVISGKKSEIALSGFKMEAVDSAVMEKFTLGSISEAIAAASPIFIKNYGSGGSATLSLRGTGASGSQVTWNGLRIDNPMLGQSDLSIVPAGMTDKIKVYYGGSSMILNSGASGGIISLETAPEWSARTAITVNPGFGSFGKYSGQLLSETGNSKFQSVTRVFYQTAENNFAYTDNVSAAEPFRNIRRNSEISQKSFMQEFYGKIMGGQLSGRLWYQDSHRNLPSAIISEYAGESQDDNSLRSMVNYENEKRFFITAAWMTSDLNYRNRLAKIDSRNTTGTWIMKTGIRKFLGNVAIADIRVSEELNTVHSVNYDGNARRNSADIALSVQNNNSERIKGSLLVREILHNNDLLTPDFSAGVKLRPFTGKEYYLNTGFSRNSKIPSMNDLYWYPGGNRDLRNEYACLSEVGFEMDDKIFSMSINYDITFFHNSIKDMIQWRPGEFSYWSASNIQSVNSDGIESTVSLSYSAGRISTFLKACYSYTSARDKTEGSSTGHLVYNPEHMANGMLRVQLGGLHATWLLNFTGVRFTNPGDDDFLPSYAVNSLSAGMQHKTDWGMIDLSFDIDNVFNAAYQNIAYYPLPGRTFALRLLAKTIFTK